MRLHLSAIALLFTCLAGSGTLQANTTAGPCIVDTLADYQTLNQCIVLPGVLVFSNFSFFSTGTGSPALLTASDITVTPIGGGLGGGFQFGTLNTFSVRPGQTATYYIDYSFFIDPGPVLAGGDLSLDPPFGNVKVTQAYCNDSYFSGGTRAAPTCSTNPPGDISSYASGLSTNQSVSPNPAAQLLTVTTGAPHSHLDFAPPAYIFGNIETTIYLVGGTSGAGFDNVAGTSSVSNSPEPATMALTFTGLFMAAVYGRRRRLSITNRNI